MQTTILKAAPAKAVLAASILLLGSGAAYAQQQINLTAGPANGVMPDGSTVPMWGYSCGAVAPGSLASCAALNPNAGGNWSPVVITVPAGAAGGLTINLMNNLSFAVGKIPTSITIVGQVGGGLGTPTTAPSPVHATQQVTWPTANSGPTNVPPPQGPRVQSFATEVAAGATTALNWPLPKPGTYLIESGTHPSIQGPMGLYGILVVTAAPTATSGTETAPGCAYPVISTTGGTTTVACTGTAAPTFPYDAEVPMLLSEIDPEQNTTVSQAVNTPGFSEATVWSGQPGNCGNPSSANYLTCYPPAVNYTPLYYMVNGVAFNKNNTSGSRFQVAPAMISPTAGTTGNVLVRIVNAGLRMHVPSIVGSQVAGATGGTNPIVTGFTVIAEDGNPLPGVPKIRSEIFMAAGKVYDVMINGEATTTSGIANYPNALALFDRELSLSANAFNRDSGMLAYISINGAAAAVATGTAVTPVAAKANPDTYILVPGQTLTVSDQSKGVLANDVGVYTAQLLTPPTNGTVSMNPNGTFIYYPNAGSTATSDSFTYCGNGDVTGGVCSSGVSTNVNLGPTTVAGGVACTVPSGFAFTSPIATYLAVKTPGVLGLCTDSANLPLSVRTSTAVPLSAGLKSVVADATGGFTAVATAAGTYNLTFTVQNTGGQTNTVTVPVTFLAGSGLTVNVLDGQDKTTTISDYRWIIEEDKTFYVDPNCQTNPPAATCPTAAAGIVPSLGVNFHTSHMPYVAQGCTGPVSCEAGQTAYDPASGSHINVVCDVGNGQCRPDTTGTGATQVMPGSVALDPTKRYYISILPGDAANPFEAGFGGPDCQYGAASSGGASCGHGMGGAPIPAACQPTPPATTCTGTFAPVTVLTQPSPYPPGKLSVFVFEDDFPLNGEQDGGGGVDVVSPNEPGLGGFQIHLWDAMGGNGDFTGQMTYDMFNQPLTNSLAGTVDPNNGNDACPVGVNELSATTGANPTTLSTDPTATGITGMIVTCPKYESDGATLSPLAGQAVIANLMPGRWGVIATPGADRIARGEEWLQTNTLDGQKAHDVFTRIGEPSYFQEFGPASYHVSIGFANPAIINARKTYLCNGTDPYSPQPGKAYVCNNTITGKVTGEHLSRTPDERLYSTGSHDTYYWTQCYVSFGDPDGEDFAFTKCKGDGTFTLTGLPPGQWRVTVFDQWNDGLVDGLSTPVGITGSAAGQTVNMGDIATTQWETNLYTKTFIDDNRDGIYQGEDGIPFANVAVRLRDGSLENLLVTDFTGTANFNETFPLFSWYTVETDVTRYKNTGTHVVYDVGGPVDGSTDCGTTGYPPCGTSTIGSHLASTQEIESVPVGLRVPGAVYCKDADCSTHVAGSGLTVQNIGTSTTSQDPPSVCTTNTGANPPTTSCSTRLSSGRIDPPWVGIEGWQGFPGQNNFLEFGKAPYFEGENGGIKGHVIYASTRPFDDPQLLVQTQWEPLVPNVTINLYQEGVASDGITPTLTLVDTTTTSSFDDFAQGVRADGVTPNMSCPGQGSAVAPSGSWGSDNGAAIPDLFFFSLYNQPNYLSFYASQHGGAPYTPLPYNSQFKCYDGMHNWNQIQPVPYDGAYKFPSVTSTDKNGRPTGTNCSICAANPDPVPATGADADPLRAGLPMLPPGKYVVEVVLPPGYELVKEEDKNILIGDNFIAPATQQFGGLGNIFIIPDQASVATGYAGPGYNANNAQNPTQSFGTTPSNNIVPGFIPEPTWPCVGEARVVPDYISLYPQSQQVAPFAGATRHLCDRKEVTLNDQSSSIAKFYIYTSTHIASKFTGGITDDYTSEFDPFSPQFGEKFAPPNLPVSLKDWTGNEISRVYADHWGAYNGMTYSTWEVNPPNPTGYSPTMMVVCMNDPGPIPGPNSTMITDPSFTPGYSQFCYELPFMPGTTQYLDTPVVPTSAFAGAGYNNPDCSYPTLTPAIAEVDSSNGTGPWVSAAGAGHTLTITALGDQSVPNYAYSGPAATTAPFNQKTITRHYGFGASVGTGYCTGLPGSACVTIGGVHAPLVGSWGDTSITVTVPAGVANCAVQQQAQYGGSTAQCGQLVITASNGKSSIDAVTVTIGGKPPTHIAASASVQAAIDAAAPGDLLMIDPTCNAAAGAVACQQPAVGGVAITGKTVAAHNELLLMWKPVRLQGVGAVSSVINANTHPAGKLDPWRQKVNCLFGLTLQGTPITAANPYDPSGQVTCPWAGANHFVETANNNQVDPLPLEAIVGWDASQNGNLAQLLQEPSLMGALEGAGVTVLGKGVNFPSPLNASVGAAGELGGFPTGTTLLTGAVSVTGGAATGDANQNCHTSRSVTTNPFPSNFVCNPSGIDGLTITDSSQGGGGIFLHGWNHYMQIANNRIYGNAGTLSGGINMGQGEFAPANIQGSTTNAAPGSCVTSGVPTNAVQPYCENLNVNIHNNNISLNSSTGDELFSGTPAGAGGVSICTGSDYYKFNYNWVCGNLSSGDGGGVAHMGLSYNGDIEHNSILFNQSLNPTIPANGGGLLVMGTPDVDTTCGATVDVDCLDPAVLRTPSDGIGPGLVINANLIMGNAAEAGSGGGVRLQNVNGGDVLAFPNTPTRWWAPMITNNIIADNVAGWDGAGISLLDALNVNIINNTIVSNSTTASAGILFDTIGAPLASSEGTNCRVSATTSCPQPAGLVSVANSSSLVANLPNTIHCPADHGPGGTGLGGVINGVCRNFSYPLLMNNIFWQNSAYYIGVGALSKQFQQNVVSLYTAFTTTLAGNQATTGSCSFTNTAGAAPLSYWDIGVRGDTGPGSHANLYRGAPVTLNPVYSVMTSTTGYAATNHAQNPNFVAQYCDGARTPPEFGASGWFVPPGIADATVPNPVFNLTPVATVDEGNNWINLRWGPLSLVNPVTGTTLGNYAPSASFDGTAAGVPTSEANYNLVPKTDFAGNVRPEAGDVTTFDPGALEFGSAPPPPPVISATLTPPTWSVYHAANCPSLGCNFGNPVQVFTLTNTGNAPLTGISQGVLGGANAADYAVVGLLSTCGPAGANGQAASITTLAPGATCVVTVQFRPLTSQPTGDKPATISVTDAAGTQTSALNGTDLENAPAVTFSAPAPALTTSPANTSVKNGVITVSYPGSATVPLYVAGATINKISGPGGTTFSVTGGTCVSGAVVNAGGSCTINVRYNPPGFSGTTTATATVTLTGNLATGGTQTSASFQAN